MQAYAILSEDVLSLTSNSLPFLHIEDYYFCDLSHLLASILVIYSLLDDSQPVARNLLFSPEVI